jgi:tetratricopeptide (TPR) repeat protein
MYQLIAREERYRELAQELSFKALMYDNNLPEAYRAMGLSYFLWGKMNEAAASCTKAIEIDPDDFIAHWTLGRIYFTEGKLDKALDLFRRVAEIKPGFYAGHLDVAQTCMGLARTEEADAAYRQLLELLIVVRLNQPGESPQPWRPRGGQDVATTRSGKARKALSGPAIPVMLYNAVHVYVYRRKLCHRALPTAIDAGYRTLGWMLNDPT